MLTATIVSDPELFRDIVMLIAGALLGLIASLFTMVVQRLLDKKGKLQIFYRFSHQRNGRKISWGFENTGYGHVDLTIPVLYEFLNTSNTTRVIRDVSLVLYNGSEFVAKLIQLDHLQIEKKKNGEVVERTDNYYGAEKGSYSFVLPPRSIQRQECEYYLAIPKSKTDEYFFDTIMIRFYDERNKRKEFWVRDVKNCWDIAHFKADEDWILLRKKKK